MSLADSQICQKKRKFLFVAIQTLRQNLELYLSPKNKNKSIYD